MIGRQSKATIMPLLFALLLLLLPAGAARAQAQDNPQSVVRQLFADHFMHDMGFTRESVARKRAWLTPDLSQQIDAYFRRPSVPDQVPVIDGDPFTNTQEYPSAFAAGAAVQSAGKTSVPVVMTIGTERRTVQVQVVRQTPGWRVDDLVYADGSTFRVLLKEQP
jgi:hypothetical protein